MSLRIKDFHADGIGEAAYATATIVGDMVVEVALYGEDATWEYLTANLDAIYAEKVAEIERDERRQYVADNIVEIVDSHDAAICALFEMMMGEDDGDTD